MTKHNWIILLLINIISLTLMNSYFNGETDQKIKDNQLQLEHKLDSILIMQKEIYQLDSCYLKATRIHMGQCAFELKEGIEADTNN